MIFISTLHVSKDRIVHHEECSLLTVFTGLYKVSSCLGFLLVTKRIEWIQSGHKDYRINIYKKVHLVGFVYIIRYDVRYTERQKWITKIMKKE